MEQFCSAIFPDISLNVSDPDWLEGRTILAATNKEVNKLNDMLASWLPGNIDTLKSADQLDNIVKIQHRIPPHSVS